MPVFEDKWLRRGRGVRDERLPAVRGTSLGRFLRVDLDDDDLEVLVKVLWQVEWAVDRVIRSARDRQALRYAFNTPPDAELNRLDTQRDRLALLAAREGAGHGRSTTDKLVRSLAKEIADFWRADLAPVPSRAQLEERRLAEADGLDLLERLVLRFNAPNRAEIEALLPSRTLHFEVEDRNLATVRTREGTEFLCVFTKPGLLDEFRLRTGVVHERAVSAKGAHLLHRLVGAGGVGLAFNPVVGGGLTTYWTAGEVAAKWSGGSR